MASTTKRDLVKRISSETNTPRPVVRQVVQQMLDDIVDELAHGRRLEFRDFGVFETVRRKPRVARNPRTGLAVRVPAKTVVHFKQGRIMKGRVAAFGEREAGAGAGSEDLPGGEERPSDAPGPP